MFKKIFDIFYNETFSILFKMLSFTAISQLISIIFTPVITRLYSPVEFGHFTIFLTLSSFFVPIISFRYENAVLIPKRTIDVKELYYLSLLIMSIFSFIILIFTNIFIFYSNSLFEYNNISYRLLLPVYIFLMGFYYLNTNLILRINKYKVISISLLIISIITLIGKVFFGLFSDKDSGLILATVIGQLVGIIYLQFFMPLRIYFYNLERLWAISKEYKDFFLYNTPSEILATLSNNLSTMLIGVLFPINEVGQYGLALKIVFLPVTIIGNSARQVFFNRASKLLQRDISLITIFNTTTLQLFILGAFPTILLVVGGKFLFTFFFGEKWGLAGSYSAIMAIWALAAIINIPATSTLIILKKQKARFYIDILGFVGRLLIIILGYIFLKKLFNILIIYVLFSTIYNLIIILFAAKIVYNYKNT